MEPITKRSAKQALGVERDADLARVLGVSRQLVYMWGGDDAELPAGRQWELRARFPKLFPTRKRRAA
jgi:hypothetical protein